MKRVLIVVVVVVVALGLGGGCDIIYHDPPVTAGQRTGIFEGITTSDETNDTSCSSFLADGIFIFDFENFDKTEAGYDVILSAGAPASANVPLATTATVDITDPSSLCPFKDVATITFEFGPPAPAPEVSGQSNEDFTPVVIRSAIIAAGTPCADPTCAGNSGCMAPIPESRLLDVRMFCFTQ